MLAVLPFENLGSPADEYFSDGITDAIIVHLAGNPSLGVISRNSSKKYKNTEKRTQKIGEELGVDYLLRGTVYWEREPGNRVRITGSLIRVSDDVNEWTDSYDKDLTRIFDLQEEVAFAVASALNLALDTDTASKLSRSTTANLDAYDYFLRGNEYLNKSWERTHIEIAASLYRKAVEIDTTFSEAYAMLSRTEASMFWEYYDRSEQRCLNAFAAADRSLKLRDDLPAGYLAMGYYYYHCATDYTLALQSFERGLRRDPNNSDIINAIAAIHRRQGEMNIAIEEFTKSLELDPQSHLKAFELAITYGMLRRYEESNEYLERAVSLAPDNPLIHIYRVWLPIFENGDVEAARRLLKDASTVADLTQTKYFWWLLRMLDFQNERSLSEITPATDTVSYLLFRSQENRLKGNESLERLYADSAKTVLEQKILEHPDDSRYTSSLGLAWAGLRNKEQALSNAYRALELLPFSKETFDTPYLILNLAEILVIFEEYDEAVKQLETLLSIPGFASTGFLKRDPLWRPLHNHPEFQQLLKKASQSSS
jgi:TolB-like protein/Flp pilus assembly protein TadD